MTIPNTTPTPNELYNGEMPKMTDTELRVVLVVTRATLGWEIDPETGRGSASSSSGGAHNKVNKAWVKVGTNYIWDGPNTDGLLVLKSPSHIKGAIEKDASTIMATVSVSIEVDGEAEPIWYVSKEKSFNEYLNGNPSEIILAFPFELCQGKTYRIGLVAGVTSTSSYLYDSKAEIEEVNFKKLELWYKDVEPPCIEITKPQNALYINDKKLCFASYPIIFGPIHVQADAFDSESGIDKVEFYLNNKLKQTDEEAPYTWYWNEPGIGMIMTLKVKVYDNDGNNRQDQKTIYLYCNPSGSFGNECINDDSILTSKNFQNNKYKKEFTIGLPNSEGFDIDEMEEQGIKILYTYEFDFGDGATETVENVEDSSYSVEHTYAKIGTYEVSTKITADIEVDMDCEYDGYYTTVFTAQQTVEITNSKNSKQTFFNMLPRMEHSNLFLFLQKILNNLLY